MTGRSASPRSWLRTTSPSRAGSTLLARYPTSSEASVVGNGTVGDRATAARASAPRAAGRRAITNTNRTAIQRGSARLERLPGRRDVDRPDDEREGDDGDGDPDGRPAEAAAEAHRQAARGSLEAGRGRSRAGAADPRSGGAGSARRPAASRGRTRRSAGSRPSSPPRSSASGRRSRRCCMPARRDDLRDQVLVEHEVVRVQAVRDRLEQPPAVGAQARVVLGQVEPEGRVLDAGQEPVGHELPARHAAGERVAQEPRPEHEVGLAGEDRRDEVGDPGRVVLVVGVEHHDDVGAPLERPVVAGLLVAAVAQVLAVDDDLEAELAGDLDGLVLRHVVDEDHVVDEVVRDVGVRPLERLGRVVGGHDDDDLGGARAWAATLPARTAAAPPRSGWYERHARCHHRHDTVRGDPAGDTMFERLFGDRRGDPALADRVPPGQYVTEKFPVLHYGSVPRVDLATWDLKVYGEVDNPLRLHLGRVQGPAAQAGHDRHPLRHPLVEARHPLGGRRDPDDPRARPGPAGRHPRRGPRRAGLHGQRAARRCSTTTTSSSPTPSTASRSRPTTGIRCGSSSRSATSGRAPSGCAASSSCDHDMPGLLGALRLPQRRRPVEGERFSE